MKLKPHKSLEPVLNAADGELPESSRDVVAEDVSCLFPSWVPEWDRELLIGGPRDGYLLRHPRSRSVCRNNVLLLDAAEALHSVLMMLEKIGVHDEQRGIRQAELQREKK